MHIEHVVPNDQVPQADVHLEQLHKTPQNPFFGTEVSAFSCHGRVLISQTYVTYKHITKAKVMDHQSKISKEVISLLPMQ